eukprot:4444312-Prorocentrum_lima.AAC.1
MSNSADPPPSRDSTSISAASQLLNAGHTALSTTIKDMLTSRDTAKGRLADFHSDLQLVRSTRDRVLT